MYEFYIEIIVIIILILFNAYLSMAEIAIVSSKRVTLQKMEKEGERRAHIILEFLDDPNEFLSAIQIGITLIGILTGALGGATLAEPLGLYLEPYLTPAYSETIAMIIVVLITTYFSLIIGEIVPKRIAMNNPEESAVKSAKAMHYITSVSKPIIKALSGSVNLVLKIVGSEPSNDDVVTEEEIKLLIKEGIEDGTIEKEEESIIKRVFRLDAQKVDMIMTPRNDIIWIDLDEELEEMKQKVVESKRSIFPIAEGDLDDFLGVIQAKDILSSVFTNNKLELRKNIKNPLVVPENLPSMELLKKFKSNKKYVHMALVVDEFGTLEGLITLNDLLEGIVGDIPGIDEEDDPKAIKRRNGSWLIEGRYPIDEFKELFHIEEKLPLQEEDNYTTVAGFLLSYTGKIPEAGEKFQWSNYNFKIASIDGHHIDKIIVREIEKQEDNLNKSSVETID